jgi:hypothetical protein
MNIFDAHISGSLSVSGSGEISNDLTVLGTLYANINGNTTNAQTASFAPNYTLTSSFGAFTSSLAIRHCEYFKRGCKKTIGAANFFDLLVTIPQVTF